MTSSKRYPIRDLKKIKGLPGDTWLYEYPKHFLMKSEHFPPNCTWCGTKLDVIKGLWRRCAKCDMREEDE